MVAVENESKAGAPSLGELMMTKVQMVWDECHWLKKDPLSEQGSTDNFISGPSSQGFARRSLVREPIKKRITVLMSNHSTKHYDGVPPNWKHELCDMGSSHSRCFLALFWAGLTVPWTSPDVQVDALCGRPRPKFEPQ